VRSIGLFGIVEADPGPQDSPAHGFRSTETSGTKWSPLGKFFRENGLYTFVRWNTFFTNPPLVHQRAARCGKAFAIIDKGLEITDRAVKG